MIARLFDHRPYCRSYLTNAINHCVVTLLNKVLDAVEPSEVLLLLLHIYVVGDEHGEVVCNPTGVEVALEDTLDFLIELLEWRSGVEVVWVRAEDLSGVGGLALGQLDELLNHEVAVGCNQVELQGALAGSLNENLDINWVGWLLVVLLDSPLVHISHYFLYSHLTSSLSSSWSAGAMLSSGACLKFWFAVPPRLIEPLVLAPPL